MSLTIAIDGPVGAGKSSVADGVAEKLGVLHLDTGAMYRAFAWKALQEGVATGDEAALCALTERALPEVTYREGKQHTFIDGQDVSGLIRTPEVSMAASDVSRMAGVRAAMVARQQALAAKQDMVLDGRDIGTRVLPQATLKIFLTASPEVRARRRFDEMTAKGQEAVYESVLADVIRRDAQDTGRAVDPLRPAEDAQLLDSSDLTQAQVIEEIVRRARLTQSEKPRPAEAFTPLYKAARALAFLLFHTIYPVRYHDAQNILLDAPYILIGNHNSMLDPLMAALPCYRYQVRYLGKKELVKNPVLRWMFRGLQMIPVDRHNMDMPALRQCLKTLKEGHALGIFPEGTRYSEGIMEHLESGVAMIALMSKAPLVPVYITGKPRLFRLTHVYFGLPLPTKAWAEKGVSRENGDELLHRITGLYREMAEAHDRAAGGEKRP